MVNNPSCGAHPNPFAVGAGVEGAIEGRNEIDGLAEGLLDGAAEGRAEGTRVGEAEGTMEAKSNRSIVLRVSFPSKRATLPSVTPPNAGLAITPDIKSTAVKDL